MDGVLISSRFFLVNIFRVLFPSIPASFSLTYRPPTHPRTRHLCAPRPALRGSCVASRPPVSHGNWLSGFLLPLAHIEPRRLTDTQTRRSPQTARACHPLCARRQFHQWKEGGEEEEEEGGRIYLWLLDDYFRIQTSRNAKRAATHTQ